MPFADFETEDRRLVILRLLEEDNDYRVNTSILRSSLDLYGHNISRDRLHTDVQWLSEQGLTRSEQLNSVQVVTLTQQGLDVANGRARVPGVKRPGPK